MKSRTIRIACAGAALSGLMCTLAVAPAQAATPRGWEADALGLSAVGEQYQGAGITVAVLDTGVEANHPALKGRVTTGPDYRKDGLGPGDPEWGQHGTAMASDVLKVAPKAKILSVRVIDDKSDEESDRKEMEDLRNSGKSPVADGINYAVDHGVDVISMSLGGDALAGGYDDDEAEALAYAAREGVEVLASAGNDAEVLNDASYPAGYSGVIAVAATKPGGARADFSTVRTYNAVAAPGVDVISAKNTGGYGLSNGTSPACALAAGVVALMHSRNPKLTPAQTRDILTSTAQHPPGGRNALVGYGVINASAAVKAAASAPADKTGPVAYKGKEHLAAPDGTPKITHPDIDQGLWMAGLGAAGVGLLLVISGLLLALLGRRKRPASTTFMTPPSSPFPT